LSTGVVAARRQRRLRIDQRRPQQVDVASSEAEHRQRPRDQQRGRHQQTRLRAESETQHDQQRAGGQRLTAPLSQPIDERLGPAANRLRERDLQQLQRRPLKSAA
jgi:hypothetical protein